MQHTKVDKKVGVRAKITVPITIASVVAFGVTAFILIVMFSFSLSNAVETQQQKILAENENRLQAFMAGPEKAAILSSTLYENMMVSGSSRKELIETLADVASSNTDFDAVWLVFEKNAYDGKDAEYAGQEELGSDAEGRLAACVVMDGSKPVITSMEVAGEDYYETAKSNKAIHVTTPYWSEYETGKEYVISISVPVIVDNNVVGVCGIDISMTAIDEEITSYKLYKHGNVRLMSGDGTFVAHEDDTQIGVMNTSAAVKKAIAAEGYFKERSKGNIYAYSQVLSEQSDAKWIVELQIPTVEANQSIYIAIIVAILVIATSIFIILKLLARIGDDIEATIVTPVGRLSKAAKKMSLGDLEIELEAKGDDEISELTRAFQKMIEDTAKQADLLKEVSNGNLNLTVASRSNKDTLGHSMIQMVDRLNDVFSYMNIASTQLDSASSQVAHAGQSLAEGATSQAMLVNDINIRLNDLSKQTLENVKQTQQAEILSSGVMKSAENGQEHMGNMIAAVNEINQANQQINQVMAVIDGIASQTNLLALNASIEASRAGEMGRGFAIVAEEVRELAGQSAQAAKDTRELITNSIAKAELGAKISVETEAAFTEIVSGIHDAGEIVTKIAGFMLEQQGEIVKVTKDVKEIDAVVQSVSAAAEESAAASEEMSAQATSMAESIGEYQLREN